MEKSRLAVSARNEIVAVISIYFGRTQMSEYCQNCLYLQVAADARVVHMAEKGSRCC